MLIITQVCNMGLYAMQYMYMYVSTRFLSFKYKKVPAYQAEAICHVASYMKDRLEVQPAF